MLRSAVVALGSIVALSLAAPARATYPGANGEIAYARYGGKTVPSTIRTIWADGTRGRVLARPGLGLPDAEWSPDGTEVAMILGKEPNRIAVLDLSTDVRSTVIRSDDVPNARLIDSLGISPAGDAIVFCAVLRGPSTRPSTRSASTGRRSPESRASDKSALPTGVRPIASRPSDSAPARRSSRWIPTARTPSW
jgi:hypothetical protein